MYIYLTNNKYGTAFNKGINMYLITIKIYISALIKKYVL